MKRPINFSPRDQTNRIFVARVGKNETNARDERGKIGDKGAKPFKIRNDTN